MNASSFSAQKTEKLAALSTLSAFYFSNLPIFGLYLNNMSKQDHFQIAAITIKDPANRSLSNYRSI